MSGPPRDWDKELSDIDRVIEKQGREGPAPRPGAPAPLPPGPSGPAAPPARRRGGVALTWFWVLLALAMAVALPLWPYQRACGLQVVFFIGASAVTAIVGGLAAVSSWVNRRGLAHVISLLVIGWALAVGASEILPRVGYARVAETWTCPDEPVPPPAPVGGAEAAPGGAPAEPPAP